MNKEFLSQPFLIPDRHVTGGATTGTQVPELILPYGNSSAEQSRNHHQAVDTPESRQVINIKDWAINFSPEIKTLSDEIVEQAIELLGNWEKVFPREDTWIQQNYGIPSLITRLDCVAHGSTLQTYEVEERPAGIGVCYTFNQAFQERLDNVKQTWPEFSVVISDDPRRRGHDDQLWLPVADKNDPEGLVLVRAEPDEEAYHHLEGRSISSLKSKGDKSYGEALGLWRKVTHGDELPWDESFVLKPRQGSKTRDVFPWIPNDESKRMVAKGNVPGAFTRSKISGALEQAGADGLFLQPFHAPMERPEDPDNRWMIYRVYFGRDLQDNSWNYLGGMWNARNNLKIHGAGDSITGNAV